MPTVSLNPQRRPPEPAGPTEFARSSNAAAWAIAKEPDENRKEPNEDRDDPLLAFDSEHTQGPALRTTVAPAAAPPRRGMGLTPGAIGLGLLALVVGAAGTVSYSRWRPGAAAPAAAVAPTASEGRAIINSNPAGALVFIDGVARGATPLDLLLPIGTHTVQLQNGAAIRTLPLEVQPSQATSHYIELPVAPLPPVTRVESPPARTEAPPARPAEVSSRPAVSQTRDGPPPRAATPAPAPQAPPAPAPAVIEGWASISVPFPAQVTQNGRAIGTTGAGPLALPAGVHTLDLANATFEFRTTLTVAIVPGETTRLSVTLPNGSLSINALPWAEVFVDGRSIGTTPLANVPIPIGSREILWRHPQFGDRRRLINVTARSPVRLGTDFNR